MSSKPIPIQDVLKTKTNGSLGSMGESVHVLTGVTRVSILQTRRVVPSLVRYQQSPHVCLSWHSVRAGSTMSGGQRVQAVLVDLSGTLHIEDTAIPGAQEALKKLQDSNIKVKFVTNTTKEPLRTLHDRLSRLGFSVKKEEIFTSLTAARGLLERKRVRPLLLLEECAKEDFEGIDTSDPNAVVVGLAPSCFHYDSMNQAFRLLLDGAPLIAIHKARYYKKADGLLYLGPGPFVSGLEYATDSKAEVVGKPEKAFFHEAIRDLGVKPENTAMIGDDARDDVGGAMDAGMMGILVKTGKYRAGDETKIPPPTCLTADFPAAVDFLLSHS